MATATFKKNRKLVKKISFFSIQTFKCTLMFLFLHLFHFFFFNFHLKSDYARSLEFVVVVVD